MLATGQMAYSFIPKTLDRILAFKVFLDKARATALRPFPAKCSDDMGSQGDRELRGYLAISCMIRARTRSSISLGKRKDAQNLDGSAMFSHFQMYFRTMTSPVVTSSYDTKATSLYLGEIRFRTAFMVFVSHYAKGRYTPRIERPHISRWSPAPRP